MAECVTCGADLEDPVRQPAEGGEGTEALHYLCSGCGAGGFQVVDQDGEPVRTGGPAFDGAEPRAATDGGVGPEHRVPVSAQLRQAAALERIADEMEYRNAVLCELVRTLDAVAANDQTVRSLTAIQTAIDDHRVTREEVDP